MPEVPFWVSLECGLYARDLIYVKEESLNFHTFGDDLITALELMHKYLSDPERLAEIREKHEADPDEPLAVIKFRG